MEKRSLLLTLWVSAYEKELIRNNASHTFDSDGVPLTVSGYLRRLVYLDTAKLDQQRQLAHQEQRGECVLDETTTTGGD